MQLLLGKLSRLGRINSNLHSFLSAYYQWKKTERQPVREQLYHDFTAMEALRRAETTFYKVGVSAEEANQILDEQMANLKELARFIVAHVCSAVLSDERVLTDRSFIESVDLRSVRFDPEEMRERYARFFGAGRSEERRVGKECRL